MKNFLPASLLFTSSLLVCGAALALGADAYEGQPESFKAGASTGAAVWRDGAKLKVRFSSGKATTFQGKVCSRDALAGFSAQGLEDGDSAKLGPMDKCVQFKLTTNGDDDGFDFDVPSKVVIFDLREGQTALPPTQVWVGRKGEHPAHTPFSLEVK
ncbi:MAG: hypothetical protein RJA70_4158 [Pseudomonadota bacterium]|jgi:hypothetical protein